MEKGYIKVLASKYAAGSWALVAGIICTAAFIPLLFMTSADYKYIGYVVIFPIAAIFSFGRYFDWKRTPNDLILLEKDGISVYAYNNYRHIAFDELEDIRIVPYHNRYRVSTAGRLTVCLVSGEEVTLKYVAEADAVKSDIMKLPAFCRGVPAQRASEYDILRYLSDDTKNESGQNNSDIENNDIKF